MKIFIVSVWPICKSYVEEISRWAMFDPDEAVLFIRECLDQTEKIHVVTGEVEGPPVLKMKTYS